MKKIDGSLPRNVITSSRSFRRWTEKIHLLASLPTFRINQSHFMKIKLPSHLTPISQAKRRAIWRILREVFVDRILNGEGRFSMFGIGVIRCAFSLMTIKVSKQMKKLYNKPNANFRKKINCSVIITQNRKFTHASHSVLGNVIKIPLRYYNNNKSQGKLS